MKNISLILLSLFIVMPLWSQIGSLDYSFNPIDNGYFGNRNGAQTVLYNIGATLQQMDTLSDGRIIIVGTFNYFNGTPCKNIALIRADGSVDHSFFSGDGLLGANFKVLVQNDDKIVVANGTSFNQQSTSIIFRLNTDGSIDPTFNIGTGQNSGAITDVKLLPDGKFLVSGAFTSFNGTAAQRIIRLNSDGSVDATFDSSFGANGLVSKLLCQPDGKYILLGSFLQYQGNVVNRIVRINNDGSFDPTFISGTGFNSFISAAALQEDGKIVVIGEFNSYKNTPQNGIVRILPNGDIDISFNTGTGFPVGAAIMSDIAVHSSGKIIVVGRPLISYNGTTVSHIICLTEHGELDPNFAHMNDGPWYTFAGSLTGPRSIYFTNDNQIYILGLFNRYNFRNHVEGILRIHLNGLQDENFLIGYGFDKAVNIIETDQDNRLLVGGSFNRYNDQLTGKLVRLLPDGQLDPDFILDDNFLGSINTIKALPDGKIMIGGNFIHYLGQSAGRFLRLNSDGSIDNSFNVGTGFNNIVTTMELQPDGKIIVCGGFNSYNGTSVSTGVVRLNSDGSLDGSFVAGTGFNGAPFSCALQADGKIVFAGEFTSFSGFTRNRIVRLNQDGTLDNSFNIGTGLNNRAFKVLIQNDQKILVSGVFSQYRGVSRNRIVRINANGTIDNTFSIGSGANESIPEMQLQSDGKIIIGGHFTEFNNTPMHCLGRLNLDGSVDNEWINQTFDYVISPHVATIKLINDGTLVLGGSFSSIDGVGRNRISKAYYAPPTFDLTISGVSASEFCPGDEFIVNFTSNGSFSQNNIFTVELSDAAGVFTSPIPIGSLESSIPDDIQCTIPVGLPASSNYLIRVVSSQTQMIGTPISQPITLHPTYQIELNESICVGSNFLFNGTELEVAGQYSADLQSTFGCDSLITLNLTVINPIEEYVTATFCSGSSYEFDGQFLTSSGNYTATFTSTNTGCDSTVFLALNEISLDLIVTPIDQGFSANQSGALYQWGQCIESTFSPVPGATNQEFFPENDGAYAVIITDQDCVDTSMCMTFSTVGLSTKSMVLAVYPNPAENVVYVETSESGIGKLMMTNGQFISSYHLSVGINQIPLENLSSGVYLFEVANSTNNNTYRIIVQR